MPKSQNPLQQLRRSSSTLSPFKRTKPVNKQASAIPRLDDVGTIGSLPPPGIRQDVVSLIKYIKTYSFEELPERAGMNSTQISSTLRFRSSLPLIVSLAHLYALSSSTTSTERELARLVVLGVIRRVSIPGRGKGGAAVGEGVVLTEDWEKAVRDAALSTETKERYLDLMRSQPDNPSTTMKGVSDAEVQSLVTAGLLTSPTALSHKLGGLFAPLSTSSLLNIASAGSTAPTGTLAAIGGSGAIHDSGGSGSMLATSATRSSPDARATALQVREMTFSLPNTGAYLKLLASARAHLILLLRQLSPKWKESTIDLLKEKWDGGLGSTEIGDKKRSRGEGNGLLAGKTRKWREFMGLQLEYVLAEALGSGIVELFETGSVGPAVRMR